MTRIGATVRRPQTATSASVHALLGHLEDTGFDGAPRYLGEDPDGREVLSYVEGDVPIQPTPGWAHSDSALVSVADLLRRYHLAVQDFDAAALPWRTRVPEGYRRGVVSHNDPNLDNVVFRDGVAVALIDFDLASPGCPVWDLATAARLWVPLQDPQDVAPALVDRTAERLRLFVDASGLTGDARREIVLAAPRTLTWGYDIVRDGARDGHLGYADYWSRAQQRFLRASVWLEDNLDALLRAVTRA